MKKGRGNIHKWHKLNWKVTWSSARKGDRKRKISSGKWNRKWEEDRKW